MADNKKKETLRAIKFTLFFIRAVAIELAYFALLNETLHLPYHVSYITALVLSVLWNFTLNRKFTFQSANNVPKAMLLVALFYCAFTPLTGWLEHVYTMTLGWNEYVATILNMVLNFVTEYLYDRFVVFRNSIDTNDIAKKEQAKEETK